jgi:hypothetical protein
MRNSVGEGITSVCAAAQIRTSRLILSVAIRGLVFNRNIYFVSRYSRY